MNHIAEPGLDLRIALGRVRDEVLLATGKRQEPFVYGSLGGATMSLVPPLQKVQEPDAAARVDFELAAQIGTRLAWGAFLAKYKTGLFADMARVQNRRLTEAEDGREKAEAARREAELIAAEKTEELRKQVASLTARQDSTRQRPSDEVRKDSDAVDRQGAAEQAQLDVDEARRKMEAAQKETDAARQQVDDAKRTAAAEGQQRAKDAQRLREPSKPDDDRLASLQPAPAPLPSLPKMDMVDTARLLQAHLRRVGCEPGTINGNWTERSRNALEQFRSKTQGKYDTRVASLDALDAIRAQSERICPLECASGQRADGERCINIGCDRGFALNVSGVCERRPDRARKAQTVAQRKPAAAASSRTGGGKCFVFSGKNYCE